MLNTFSPFPISNEEKMRRYDVLAKIAMKYGPTNSRRLTEDGQKEYYEEFEDYTSFIYLIKHAKASEIKWYIHNRLKVDHPIWNADFISGITTAGHVHWSTRDYPSFRWWGNSFLTKILEDCPYYGKIKNDKPQKKGKHCFSWQGVPALYLKPSKETISYIAGILCTGRVYNYKGENYALYQNKAMEELREFGVPMEAESKGTPRPLISPFWPALFLNYMPECCRDYWMEVKKPYNGAKYAAIFWLTHVSNKIERGGLPYLPSKRTVFYKFKDDGGTIRQLQRLRVKYNLVSLDPRFKECVSSWIDV